jgi:hypothetical protein
MPNYQSYLKTAVPKHVTAFASVNDWNYTWGGPPSNSQRPTRLWRDNRFTNDPFAIGSERYFTLAFRNGQPDLKSVDSQEVLRSYSLSVCNTLRQFRDLFPAGVPYIDLDNPVELPVDEVRDFNFFGTQPAIAYPVSYPFPDNLMLIQHPRTGDLVTIDYQEFSLAARPGILTDDQKIEQVRAILDSTETAANKLLKISRVITTYQLPNVVV